MHLRNGGGWPRGGGIVSLAFVLCSACTLDKLDPVSELPCGEHCSPGGTGSGSEGDASIAGGGGASGGDIRPTVAGGAGNLGGDGDAGPLRPPTPVAVAPHKLDLLFMIDNSISMRDKQNLLDLTNLNVLSALSNPDCVSADGNAIPALGPGLPCPDGRRRAFQPITDVHVGIVSSSLGDAGASVACFDGDKLDMAHLLGSLPRGASTGANEFGFLEWRVGDDLAALNQSFQLMLRSVGEAGCGWEMPLESWYRFLVDPFPYRALERTPCSPEESETNCIQPLLEDGRIVLDTQLLAQRAAFLRPDSLLAIVMLTDENDCSVIPEGQSWVVLVIGTLQPMFRSSSTCDFNPNHPCCYSCVLGVPAGCEEPLDPVCVASNRLTPEADGNSLRCFDQRRRFGVDFMYPTQRYVNALKEPRLCFADPSLSTAACAESDLVDNPLYAGGRDPSHVFLTGIVGVPWQRLAATVDARGNALPSEALRFKSAAELGASDWATILGAPHESPPVPPSDPFMRESSVPRAGIEPGNPVNGREYDTGQGPANGIPDDLQYACIFPLPVARDCATADPNVPDCDCVADIADRPLCEVEPGITPPGTTQHWAKAFPGLRQLEVLKGYGENAVVASICARNVSDASRPDFAYRPAFDALVERVTDRLRTE